MKKKSLSISPFVLFFVLFFNCNYPEKSQNVLISFIPDKGNAHTDFNGAMDFEFNMLKNPTTGQIPQGIRAMELQQAKQLLADQLYSKTNVLNTYTFQGPNNLGGRTRALVYDLRNGTSNSVIIAGGVSGGIYKSIDDGATWIRKSPLGDLFSVTSIAQDPRPGFQDTWYYAGGEASGNSASLGPFISSGVHGFYFGKGVYKSTDNGETWTFLSSSNTGSLETFDHRADCINKIVVNPVTGHIYIAALDAIYRSTDGGTTWAFVLTSTSGGWSTSMQTDIIVTATGRFYAAFSGTSNALPVDMPGVWTSMTGASGSWTKISGAGAVSSPAGWNADGFYGRVVLAYAPSLDSRVFALYSSGSSPVCPGATTEAEFFYWDDGTSTWTDISATLPNEVGCLRGNDPFAVQGGYDLVIAVKPDAPATVFIGGTNAYRSTDLGMTWTRIGGYASPADYSLYLSSHPDIHAFAFKPTSTITMLCGNDGGIQRTTDILAGTVAWSQINIGYKTYQYYYVTLDPRIGYAKVLGGAQDNGSTRNTTGTGTGFEMVWGGDGVSVGLTDPAATGSIQYEYVGSQSGFIYRRASTTSLGFVDADITPTGETNSGLFVTLFCLDPDNTQRLYYANDNSLYRTITASTVTSATWTTMSGISSTVGAANDITALTTTRGTYSAATSSLFIGTNNGKVYRLDDPAGVGAATTPVDITGSGFPTGYISSMAVNPRNDDTLLVSFSSYGVSSLWWTGTANSAVPVWTAVEGSLSLPSYRSTAILVNGAIVEYYVGTSVGLYSNTSLPGVTVWTQEGASVIGNAVVSSLAVRPADNTILVGTHGSGMWRTGTGITPVNFISFTGKANKYSNALEWKVENENNCYRYDVEKRNNNTGEFTNIGNLSCHGIANEAYRFTDNTTDIGLPSITYRIKQTDMDNRFVYSNLLTLKRSAVSAWVEYVSLVNNQIFLRINKEDVSEKVNFILLDAGGKILQQKIISRIAQSVTIPSGLAKGIYIIQLISKKDGKYTGRILVN